MVSGLIVAGGPPGRIVARCLEGEQPFTVGERWLTELDSILSRAKFSRYDFDPTRVVALLRANGLAVPDPIVVPSRCADPDDDYLLALAIDADAVLVTGDRHLLEVEPPPVVRTPRELLDRLDR